MESKGRIDGRDSDSFVPTPEAIVALYNRYFPGEKMDWPIYKDGKWPPVGKKEESKPWAKVRGPREWSK